MTFFDSYTCSVIELDHDHWFRYSVPPVGCQAKHYMMTSSNGNIFRVTDPLCEEFTSHRWIPLTKTSDAELWCFVWSAPWINNWVNNREAGDLRRHRAHYDVIVMTCTHDELMTYFQLDHQVHTYSSEISIKLYKFSAKKMPLKMSSAT